MADAMVAKGMHMVELYEENSVPLSRLIMRLPGTWAGIQAAKQLEQKGVATQVYLVYRYTCICAGMHEAHMCVHDFVCMHVFLVYR